MKKSIIAGTIFLVIVTFSACEKDDICVDGNTPLLILRFYDIDNPEEFKAVPSFRVVGIGKDVTVNTIEDRTSLDSIGIPLKVDENTTGYRFIINSATEDEQETGNTDIIDFNYVVRDSFVSRACGYVATYNELQTSLTTDDGNWIQDIEIITTPSIKNQDAAHVKIFH